MRTTIELPDELLTRAKVQAAQSGVSLRQFFIHAIQCRLDPPPTKVRRDPPVIGNAKGKRVGVLTAKQIDEAMFG